MGLDLKLFQIISRVKACLSVWGNKLPGAASAEKLPRSGSWSLNETQFGRMVC